MTLVIMNYLLAINRDQIIKIIMLLLLELLFIQLVIMEAIVQEPEHRWLPHMLQELRLCLEKNFPILQELR